MDISEKVKFHDICLVLEKIYLAQNIKRKEEILEKFIKSFKTYQENFRKENEQVTNASFYCILRILIPKADTIRESYGIKTTAMGKLYIKILNLSPTSEDALKLTYESTVNQPSDFADIVYNVMVNRTTDVPNETSLLEIHKILDILSQRDNKGKEKILSKFIETSSALEQKWLIRIVLKKLHLGIGEQRILTLYHPQAKNLYTINTDLKSLCDQIESNILPNTISDNICPLKYVRPMLCERLNITKLEEILKTKTFYMETKMDGERFHVHIKDEIFKYISRNGKDFTMNFGRTESEGNLTPLLLKLFNINVRNIILDGEMMVWDKLTLSFRVKGENNDVKHLPLYGNLRPCFVVYDILYLNDINYIDKPYKERIDLLHKILKEQIGVISFCKREKIKDTENFKECFNLALSRNEEGIVIKEQTSKYLPGIRGGDCWYKIKADYIKDLVTDFDLLIIGGFYSKSKKYISAYLLGVYQKTNEINEMSIFYSVGKVGSGLSIQENISLNERLKDYWIKNDSNAKDIKIENVNIISGSTVPDVWIEPKHSVILQIKASELAPTNSFGTSYALRFPRIEAIRNDKIWNECMTLQEYEEFYKNDFGVKKINKRKLHTDDFLVKKKSKSISSLNNCINPYNNTFRADEIEKVSEEFRDINICILSGYKQKGMTINDLKVLVLKHGGNIVENPIADDKCISVAGDITVRVKKLQETELYNIVSADWLIRAFNGTSISKKKSQIKPNDIIYATNELNEELKELYDQYGDSYTNKVNPVELGELLNSINSEKITPLMDSEIADLEQELCLDGNMKNIFRTMQGCFYSPEICMPKILILSKLIFQSRGGYVLDYNDPQEKNKIKLVFVDAHNDIDNYKFKFWLNADKLSRIQFISYKWIFDCNINNDKIAFRNYLISKI